MKHFAVFKKRRPSPGELNTSEKCAHCGAGFVDFSDILGDGRLLGCRVCGAVFMSKACRENEKKEPEKLIAKCGKECKSLFGKMAHERKCKECLKIE